MPALVAFKRRWQIGSDDLVFVFAGGLIARLIWVAVLCTIFGVYHGQISSCPTSNTLQAFFIGVICLSGIVIINEIAIIWMSMRGTVINTRPRRYIPIFLYIQIALYVPETCLSILGIYWAFQDSKGCDHSLSITVKITVILQWCIFLSALTVVIVFFDPLGSTQMTGEQHDFSLKEKSSKVWERRCKILCCCFAGHDDDYMDAISGIANMFASELHDIDAVPSDVAVGLILLQEKQEEEETQKMQDSQAVVEGVPFDQSDPSQKKLLEDATYFMKYSLGSYGWPMYVFMNPCCGMFHFCGKVRCCSCCGRDANARIMKDNCCMCNTAALQLQLSLPEQDLFYCTYHDKLYEIPFYVALDGNRKAIVISIRGTLSMRDTITDLTGHGERIDMEGLDHDDWMAHKGMFLSAQYIKSQLVDKGILQGAFDEAKQRGGDVYRLIVVGHSLGAGTASVLSILLKPLYPGLQCFAYSNPSVLNEAATVHCEDYVMSVVFGKDVVPRMSVKNLNTLIQDLENVIMNSNLPKYRILMTGCWRALCFFLGNSKTRKGDTYVLSPAITIHNEDVSPSSLTEPLLGERQPLNLVDGGTSSTYVDDVGGKSRKRDDSAKGPNGSQLVRLYPAGKILQIYEKPNNRVRPGPRYELTWANREIYDRVVICPTMVKDHFPDVVMNALKNVKDSLSDT